MNLKIVSYLIVGIGLLGMLVSSKIGTAIIPISNPKIILIPSLMMVGAGVIILLSFSKSSSKSKGKEVPIYKGKEIVGYRIVD